MISGPVALTLHGCLLTMQNLRLSIRIFIFNFLIDFRQREREGEREGENHWCDREAPIGSLSYVRLGMSLDRELDPQPLDLQDNAPTNRTTLARAEPSFLKDPQVIDPYSQIQEAQSPRHMRIILIPRAINHWSSHLNQNQCGWVLGTQLLGEV